MKKLILNADDFGPSPFINRGIIEGIEKGVVNSVSAMVTFGDENLRAVEDLYRTYKNQVKIGLHIAINAGSPVYKPIAGVRTLYITEEGQPYFPLYRHMRIDEMEPVQVLKEVKAQYDLLGQILGDSKEIDHINSHFGLIHMYEPFWREIIKFAAKVKCPLRNPLTAKQKGKYNKLYKNDLFLPIEKYAIKESVLQFINHRETTLLLKEGATKEGLRNREKEAQDKNIPLPDYFISQYYGQPSKLNLELILEAMREGETAEFMLHLGKGQYGKENLWGIDRNYYPTRESELKHLIQADFRKMMDDKGVVAAHYPR